MNYIKANTFFWQISNPAENQALTSFIDCCIYSIVSRGL